MQLSTRKSINSAMCELGQVFIVLVTLTATFTMGRLYAEVDGVWHRVQAERAATQEDSGVK
jgi:hypothetical protein|tara:strand:+ start:472 stop:654 length:183 start_codon:yes stop_codon:yes gene_type:complete